MTHRLHCRQFSRGLFVRHSSRHGSFNRCIQLLRCLQGNRHELNTISWFQLPNLPQVSMHDDCGTNKAAQTRAIGTQDDWHVTSEIDGSDRISVVMNVRRMQTRLATVHTCPGGLWPNQTHASPR